VLHYGRYRFCTVRAGGLDWKIIETVADNKVTNTESRKWVNAGKTTDGITESLRVHNGFVRILIT
jgi:hypothetical protein